MNPGSDKNAIAVVGTGRVGAALGPRFAALGFAVIYGSRDPSRAAVAELVERTGRGATAASVSDAVARSDWVLFAVPWSAMENLVATTAGSLNGKIVIDVTNALKIGDDGLMAMAVPTSAGEMLQSWAPEARVVKAFNTMGFHVMADPGAAGGRVSVPLAGDDADAKRAVARVVEQLGFDAVDVGPIKHARALEYMSVLYMVPYLQGRRDEAFEFYFRTGTTPENDEGVRPAE